MTYEELVGLIPEYLAGHLSDEDVDKFEKELKTSPELLVEVEEFRTLWKGMELLPEAQPSAALRAKFYQRLSVEERKREETVSKRSSWWRLGPLPQFAMALTLFALGVLVGRDRLAPSVQPVKTGEMAELHSQVQSLRQTVALSLMERPSATSRLEGIAWSNQVNRPDNELLSALTTTLNHDPNVNVRLASLDALEKFSNEPVVRKALAQAIPVQDSPLVQIALIDALVHMRDKEAAGEFRKLRSETQVNVAVRQRAQWGLEKLGFSD